MNVNRSGYYKWLDRKNNPSALSLKHQIDSKFVKEYSLKHRAHGYRWIAAHMKLKLGVIMSPNYVYRCRKYAGIMCESKHYK